MPLRYEVAIRPFSGIRSHSPRPKGTDLSEFLRILLQLELALCGEVDDRLHVRMAELRFLGEMLSDTLDTKDFSRFLLRISISTHGSSGSEH